MDLRIATYILAAILISMMIFKAVKKRTTYTKLQNHLARGEYDAFFKLLEAPLTNAFFPDYNLNFYRLNAYLLMDDTAKVNETLELLLKYPTKHKDRVELVVKAFNIYLGEGDKKRSREMLDEIINWEGDEYKSLKQDCLRSYDIVILKKSNHIGELESVLDMVSGPTRGRIEYFIALQYENAGNMEKRNEYLHLAMQDGFRQGAE